MVRMFNFKKVMAVITGLAISASLFPGSIAHAATNTITGIPMLPGNNLVETTKTASLTVNGITFDMSNHNGDFFVDVRLETLTDEGSINPLMDAGYDEAFRYTLHAGCIAPGYVDQNQKYTGTLTVPYASEHDPSSAVMIEMFANNPSASDTTKVPVTDNHDGTISVPVSLMYWEYTPSGSTGLVGEFRTDAVIEFKISNGKDTDKKDSSVKKPNKGTVSRISNVKGAKAKITVKKVKDATKYQIRYKVGSSKKWKTETSTSNTFKVKVGKGKKITVQARVANKAGYGKWGSSKKFKTDKK